MSIFIYLIDIASLLSMYMNFSGSGAFDATILAVLGGLLLAAIFRRAHMCWRLITHE